MKQTQSKLCLDSSLYTKRNNETNFEKQQLPASCLDSLLSVDLWYSDGDIQCLLVPDSKKSIHLFDINISYHFLCRYDYEYTDSKYWCFCYNMQVLWFPWFHLLEPQLHNSLLSGSSAFSSLWLSTLKWWHIWTLCNFLYIVWSQSHVKFCATDTTMQWMNTSNLHLSGVFCSLQFDSYCDVSLDNCLVSGIMGLTLLWETYSITTSKTFI